MTGLAGVSTLRSALSDIAARFRLAGLESPSLDARLLVAHALGLSREDLLRSPERAIVGEDGRRLDGLVARRLAGEPVARIVGSREFWGLDFLLSPDTLVPRPETETLVEAALAFVYRGGWRGEPLRIADLGTGTGCLLVALLHELPHALGIAVDRAPGALATARENAGRHSVEARMLCVRSDWAGALRGLDMIVSNPPYIATSHIGHLPAEVRHDPLLALDGGPDGLGAYEALVGGAVAALAPQGGLFLEVGEGQALDVERLLERHGLALLPRRHDLSGKARVVGAHRSRTESA